MQPTSEQTSTSGNCHAFFTTSPFDSFTWLTISCNKTYSEVDVVCQINNFGKSHQTEQVNIYEIVNGMLDANNNQCLGKGGLVLNSKCVLLVPVHIYRIEEVFRSCSVKGHRNIHTIRTKELITSLLQPISHLAFFAYVHVQGNICKVLRATEEPGMHQMIQKWIWDDCESQTNLSFPILTICEPEFFSSGIRNQTICGTNSFNCNNGTCLASTSLCDDQVDCTSGEDELHCKDLAKVGSYKCKDGKIITADKRCNLITNCPDGDDEVNCFHVTNGYKQKFRCSSGLCVNLEYVCDGFFNCVDHSDEKACLESCNFGFVCKDSSCVLQSFKDDLIPDCKDKSDELMYQLLLKKEIEIQYRCPEIGMIPCERGHNRCFLLTSLCKLEYDIHNKITPCRNGAHLKHCRHFPCTGSFKCPYSYCIPMRYICNGRFDCPNGEDESMCHHESLQCPGLLRCKDGGCVHPSKVCDGVVNCPNGDDERCIIKCPPSCICRGLVLSCTTLQSVSSLSIRPLHLYLRLSQSHTSRLLFVETLSDLEILDLSHNYLVEIPNMISSLSHLSHLDLSHNLLLTLSPGLFVSSKSMYKLNLKGNLINSITDYAVQGLSNLPHLDLSDRELLEIGNIGFMGLYQLQTLDLSKNNLTELKSDWFSPLKKLVYLFVTDNDIVKLDPLLFNILPLINIVHTSTPLLCCMSDSSLTCIVDSIETSPVCDRIIPSTIVLAIGISLCVTIIMANAIVIILRLISSKKSKNCFTIVNLAISDTIQGLYLLIIISNDLLYNEAFALSKYEWRNSFLCSTVGFLFPLCSSLSAISTIIIAVDRYKIIATPFKSVTEGSGTKARLFLILITWVLFTVVASAPFIPLHIVQDYHLMPTDICFFHLYDSKSSSYLTIYVNVLYGVALPYCLLHC